MAGFAEVEMESLDGKKHWYPTEEMLTDKGEKVVEEEIVIEEPLTRMTARPPRRRRMAG